MKLVSSMSLIALILTSTVSAQCPESQRQTAGTLYQQATVLSADDENSIELLRQSIAACGVYQNVYQLAYNLLLQSRFDEALEPAETALKLAPDAQKAMTWWLLGRIQWERQQTEHAKAAFDAGFASVVSGQAPPSLLLDDAQSLEQELNQRGLRSSELIANVLKSAISLNTSRATRVAPRISLQIEFDTDKASLKPASKQQLRHVASALSIDDLAQLRVKIIGHTDTRGSVEYNQALSERRAQAVYAELIKVEPTLSQRLFPSGMGETRPRAPSISEQAGDEAHAINRRVEFELEMK